MQYAVWSSACHAALRSAGAGFDLYRIEGAGHIEAALDREALRGSVAFLTAELPTQGADRQPEWVSFVFDDGVGFPQRRRGAERLSLCCFFQRLSVSAGDSFRYCAVTFLLHCGAGGRDRRRMSGANSGSVMG